MLNCYITQSSKAIPITLIQKKNFTHWISIQSDFIKTWFAANSQFIAEPPQFILIPDEQGKISRVLCSQSEQFNLWDVGHLPYLLPPGVYAFENNIPQLDLYTIAWGLGAYQFTKYKSAKRYPSQLFVDQEKIEGLTNILSSLYLVRDLINTPTENMGPSELASAAKELAEAHQAKFHEIIGEDLLQQGFACIHTVGRASDDAPRLIDLRWGESHHPKITLVGKGVCFDSGGLDIKSSSNMQLMKKDMAGGAHVLGLARMIMQAKLPICLRVLIPAVENVIGGNAYRPGDIIKSRQGMTIEIGNTDAEGRLILAEALDEAASEKPELIIDISTLTGAARIALGTDLPVMFSNHDDIAADFIKHGEREADLMWRLPLYQPYREYLISSVADINNASLEPYGGAITAALFLQTFVPNDIPWVHFDLMAWNLRARPGRPQGGEAMTLRAIFAWLRRRY
jgi:leucyl aminopeptidase